MNSINMKNQVKNGFGIRIKRCCASCAYKELTRLVTQRRCTKLKKNVKPSDVCKDWEMSETFRTLKIKH